MKKVPWFWALIVGLISLLWQILTFFLRFGKFNSDSPFTDYLIFFLSGTLGGLILLFFLNRQTSMRARWVVGIVFGLTFPIAMIFMIGGGLLGPVGALILPQVPWALLTWVGAWMARIFVRE